VNGDGDCFPTASKVAVELHHLGHPEVLVAHGLPLGTGGAIEGVRHWHAWVETRVPDATKGGKPTWAVADWSNGKPRIFIARTAYYRIGRTPQHLVWRFTLAEALAALDAYGHAGPWHPDPDSLDGSNDSPDLAHRLGRTDA
jgi:hypothetical protein